MLTVPHIRFTAHSSMHFSELLVGLATITCATANPLNTIQDARSVIGVTTTCSLVIPTHVPQSLNCGVYGSLSNSAGNLLQDTTVASLVDCAEQCTANSSCISFGYTSKRSCLLYSKSLVSMGLTIAQSGKTIMYNRRSVPSFKLSDGLRD